MIRVLIIDDSAPIRDGLASLLNSSGECQVVGQAEDGLEAVEKVGELLPDVSSGPHHQDSGEAKIRESTAGVSRKPSSDCKACGCSSKHLCGLTAWNT